MPVARDIRRASLRFATALVAVLLICLAAAPSASARGAPGNSLFGSHEIRSTSLSLFPKWSGAVARYFDEEKLAGAPCSETVFNRCHLREWQHFLDGLKGDTADDQIRLVNDYMNRHPYVIDPKNYGVPDYWAAPLQFLTKDGDCEDYAIAKYFSLRLLGFPASEMRIVVLQDLNLGEAHAVLAVYRHGRALILDNQIRTVVSDKSIHHYRPIYSINEEAWWLHSM